VCALATSAVAGSGKVDPATQAKAVKLFETGQASYQQGSYLAAIDLFKNAYQLVNDPVYLFNIAQSYRKIADCVPAHDYYVKYLEADPKAPNKDKVQQWIFELRPCVDKAREREADAKRAAEESELQRRNAEAARQAPVPQEPVETEVDRGAPFRISGIVLAGAGLLGLAIGATYGVKGNSIQSDIDGMCSPPNTCLWDSDKIQSLHGDGESANTRAKIGYIGGGVALVAGVALYMFGRNRVETVMVTPTSGGATVGASFQF
jgi:tetratricopeptide (TPR) repeat protein